MNLPRRDFLKTALAAAAASALPVSDVSGAETPAVPTADAAGHGRDYYELRAYRLKPGAPTARLEAYLAQALIPALNTRGVATVGLFTEPESKDGPAVWVLIPHRSLASVAAVTAEVNADPAVQAAAGEYFSATTKDNPAFERVDSWLLLAFAGLPQLAVPALTREGKARIFELRIYESFNEAKALNKVAMFNAGEIEVMQQLGMSPVFYGQALVGRDLPHLAYMLCGEDRATHAQRWKEFSQHPVWVKLKSDPQYADNVSKITSRFLVPMPSSQI